MGKMKAVRLLFASTTHAPGRAAIGSKRRGNARGDSYGLGDWRLATTAGGPAGPRWAKRLAQK
jgi:hypothetical protein